MEKNVDLESNGDEQLSDWKHDSGEEISCGEGHEEDREIIQLQEQSQWTCEVHKLITAHIPDPSSWSSWSQFYLNGVAAADVEGQPTRETFKRVEPLRLRDRNAHAYTPQTFNLGPFHAKPVVLEQDRFKLSAVCSLFRESSEVFLQLVHRMEKHVPLFRRLYMEEIPQQPPTLALLFAVDAVCIVAGLYYGVEAFRHSAIARDVILVENQIPVLTIKYAMQSINSAMGNSEQSWQQQLTSIVGCLLKKFSPFPHLDLDRGSGGELVKMDLDERRPLLGLLYDALTRGSSSSWRDDCQCYEENDSNNAEESDHGSKSSSEKRSMPGAFTLEKHGLKFEAQEADFTGIRFVDEAAGVTLILPKIHDILNQNKQTLLLNLVAYEQNIAAILSSNYRPVTSYVEMMGALMKGDKDVEVLVKSGVVEKEDTKKVAELWQQMVSELPYARTKADAKVEEEVQGFSDRKFNKLRAAVFTLWRGC